MMDMEFRIPRPWGGGDPLDLSSPFINVHVGELLNQIELEASLLRYARRIPSSMAAGVFISARLWELLNENRVPIDRLLSVRNLRTVTVDVPEFMLTTVQDGRVVDRPFMVALMKGKA